MIGMGVRLDRMPDIRRLFGKDPCSSDSIGKLPMLLTGNCIGDNCSGEQLSL